MRLTFINILSRFNSKLIWYVAFSNQRAFLKHGCLEVRIIILTFTCHDIVLLDMKECICHFTKSQIYPFISRGTIYTHYKTIHSWHYNGIFLCSIVIIFFFYLNILNNYTHVTDLWLMRDDSTSTNKNIKVKKIQIKGNNILHRKAMPSIPDSTDLPFL